MKNITIILPVHKIDGDYQTMLDKALASVETFQNDVKVLIVCPTKLKKDIQINSEVLEVSFFMNKGETDFCSQVNLGIENCDTDWFSILEIDDVFRPIWLKSITDYQKIYPDVSVFLPIVRDKNSEDTFITFMNESVWAYGFTERQGFLDNEVLLDFQNYQISGGLYKTDVIKENGKLKENIKLTFGYEFLLRLTNNGVRVMVVPRVGYEHTNLRVDSLFYNLKNDDSSKISEKEVKFWLDTAKKEFFFKNKRDVNYVES